MTASEIEIERLAKAAAKEVEAKLISMMRDNEEGEVAAILGFNDLQVERRPKEVVWRRKLERGKWSLVRLAK